MTCSPPGASTQSYKTQQPQSVCLSLREYGVAFVYSGYVVVHAKLLIEKRLVDIDHRSFKVDYFAVCDL